MAITDGRRNGSSWFMRDDGATAVTVAILVFVLLGLAAIVVDLGSLYTERAKLQTAADSAALAGAQQLPDTGAATTGARAYASTNAPEAPVFSISFYVGDTVYTADAAPDSQATVQPAVWRPGTASIRTAEAHGSGAQLVPVCHNTTVTRPDTVKVTVTNPAAPLYFAKIWNIDSSQVSASATARVQTPALEGVLPICVAARNTGSATYGFTVGQSVTMSASGSGGGYGWMILNNGPVEDPDPRVEVPAYTDVLRTNGTTYPVYRTEYPVDTSPDDWNSDEAALQAWYARTGKVAILPVAAAWGGSSVANVIGFTTWQVTASPDHHQIVAKFLSVVPETDYELATFWPDCDIQHYALIK